MNTHEFILLGPQSLFGGQITWNLRGLDPLYGTDVLKWLRAPSEQGS